MSLNETDVIVGEVLSDVLQFLSVKGDGKPLESSSEDGIEKLNLDLLKARSQIQVLQNDLESQASIFSLKLRQCEEENYNLRGDYEHLLRESTLQRNTFQKTLRTLKHSLDNKDTEVKSLNESNSILRSEIMENAGNFIREREKMERLREEESLIAQGLMDKKNETIQNLQVQLESFKSKYEKKARKIKKYQKALSRLKKELEEKNCLDEKTIRLRKLLEQIDSID